MSREMASQTMISLQIVITCLFRTRMKTHQVFCAWCPDVDKENSLRQTTILGGPGAIYATSRQNSYSGGLWFFEDNSISDATIVHKFNLTDNPAQSTYSSSGVVKGSVLNQFSMSEYDDIFRIATTTGYVGGNSAHNTMTLLQETADGIDIIGQIDNIAPSEDIRSDTHTAQIKRQNFAIVVSKLANS